ncbi:MAG: LysM peptidoglycan-binding domain-containing protein [bacterium]|nr:LysM peptidoglycan-binding domain-containing protein [bacterium]MCP4799369.1 LysM peptidoglycan-binding domain-containing protein [bacterium]
MLAVFLRAFKYNTPRCFFIVSVLLISLFHASGVTAAPVVEKVRFYTAPDHTRVVLDLSSDSKYKVTRFTNPERIAIDVIDGSFSSDKTISVNDGVLFRIRRNPLSNKAQVVLDLTGELSFRDFALKAAGDRPHRIVVDVYSADKKQITKPKKNENIITVVIDPGHGGIDPGCIKNGIREKDVVLKVAHELKRIIDKQKNMQAVLTRDKDYFLSLSKRYKKAEAVGGDLFISIHANSHKSRSLSGTEVFILSLDKATDEEAHKLADFENASDSLGLPPGNKSDDDVVSILMDMKKTHMVNTSSIFADEIMGAIRRSNVLSVRRVKQAGFVVLRSTLDMPSVLIETGFLSNSGDRAILSTTDGQKKIAQALNDGIRSYLGIPEIKPAKAEWSLRYKVKRGDSLWKLARRHGTTASKIKEINKLKSDNIMIGQRIKLPAESGK